MRPDQHKKEKSFKYRKKHGIQDSNTKASNESRHKGPKSQNLVENKDVEGKKEGQIISGQSSSKDESSSWGFSKRSIENNWDKYDLSSDEEAELGTDFSVLLSFAGTSSSHIKLESEKDWGDSMDNSSPLVIDCKTLAESLKNLNITKRYKLDKLINDDDIMEYLNKLDEGDLKRKPGGRTLPNEVVREMGFEFGEYSKSIKPDQPRMENYSSSNKEVTTVQSCDMGTEKPSEQNLPKTEYSKSKGDDLFDMPNSVECDKAEQDNKQHVIESCLEAPRPNNELDLGMNQECVSDDLDKELNDLLSASKADSVSQSKSTNVSNESKVTSEKCEESQLDNLEDWLDSIL